LVAWKSKAAGSFSIGSMATVPLTQAPSGPLGSVPCATLSPSEKPRGVASKQL
jgi:hypothetical protein